MTLKEDAEMSEHQLGDAPLQAEYLDKMVAIAQSLDEIFNGEIGGRGRKTGFVLMVFPFDGPDTVEGRCNFISNGADRKDIVVLMKEMITRFEGQPELKGKA